MSASNHATNFNNCVEEYNDPLLCGIATGVGVATDIALKIAGSAMIASGVASTIVEPELGGIIAATGGCIVYKSSEISNNITQQIIESFN